MRPALLRPALIHPALIHPALVGLALLASTLSAHADEQQEPPQKEPPQQEQPQKEQPQKEPPPARWLARSSDSSVRAFLWAPGPGRRAAPGSSVELVELTGQAAARLKYPQRRVLLSLSGKPLLGAVSTKGARLTLLQSGEPALTLEPQPLAEGSPLTPCSRSGRVVLAFAPEALGADGLRLSLPLAGRAPLVVELIQVRRAVEAAERDLQAWRRHTRQVAHLSAIQPYLAHPSVAALRQRDEAVLVPLLLKELVRTAPCHCYDPGAVPRFALWQILRETRWGKAQKLAQGDPDEVLGVLSDWRGANAPRLEGVVEPRELVISPEELAKKRQ